MNGVLPQPWLPLKKGQTLANFVDHDQDEDTAANTVQNGGKRQKQKADQSTQEAVVLTLRRRYSTVRKDVRHLAGKLMGKGAPDTPQDEPAAAVTDGAGDTETPESITRRVSAGSGASNPWRDAAAGPSQPARSQSYTRARRLSYDAATGVMNLPDDDGWMSPPGDEDSDEDVSGSSRVPSGEGTPGEESEDPTSAQNGQGSRGPGVDRRTSTYWHHPERKRVISGSFA